MFPSALNQEIKNAKNFFISNKFSPDVQKAKHFFFISYIKILILISLTVIRKNTKWNNLHQYNCWKCFQMNIKQNCKKHRYLHQDLSFIVLLFMYAHLYKSSLTFILLITSCVIQNN